MSNSTAKTIDPPDWFVIALEDDLPRIRRDIRRLEQAYPGRYDYRIDKDDDRGPFEVSVRHRE